MDNDAFKPVSDEDKRAIVQMVDLAMQAAPHEVSRGVLVFEHSRDENPLPYMLDYMESIGCKVDNLFTAPKVNGNVMRELVFKLGDTKPWDGSVE